MQTPNKKKLIAATAAPFALTIALGAAPAHAGSGSDAQAKGAASAGASSTAEIGLAADGCTVVSSKEISHIEYRLNGSVVAKDESIGTTTYDLTQVTFDFDSISVKAGTSVKVLSTAGCDSASTGNVADGEDDTSGDGGAHGGTSGGGSSNAGGGHNGGDNTAATTTAAATTAADTTTTSTPMTTSRVT